MTQGFEIRPAVSREGRLVAGLIRRSLPAWLRPLTIWASPRAERYVEWALGRPGVGFYLLRRVSGVAGVAAWRNHGGEAFLNHLYIAPRWRARGLGGRLFEYSLATHLKQQPSGTVCLDVLDSNTRAASWYLRLGMRPRERRGWWLGPRCVPGPAPLSLPLRLLAAAERQHHAWGFSMLRLAAAEVGRLYTPYFRLSDPAAAGDLALRAALGRLDAHRRLLLVAAAPQPAPGWRRTAASRRLAGPAELLMQRLALRGAA